jgi:excisionase family DNA binding protein
MLQLCWWCGNEVTNHRGDCEFVLLPDAARALGVKADTLRQQIANGKLSAKKAGRDWVIPQSEVDRYRAQSRRA